VNSIEPARGDVWRVNFNQKKGHEHAGIRPALVVSVDAFNKDPADLVAVLPISKTLGDQLSCGGDPRKAA